WRRGLKKVLANWTGAMARYACTRSVLVGVRGTSFAHGMRWLREKMVLSIVCLRRCDTEVYASLDLELLLAPVACAERLRDVSRIHKRIHVMPVRRTTLRAFHFDVDFNGLHRRSPSAPAYPASACSCRGPCA